MTNLIDRWIRQAFKEPLTSWVGYFFLLTYGPDLQSEITCVGVNYYKG